MTLPPHIPEWFVWTTVVGTLVACLWRGSWQAQVNAAAIFGQMVFLRAWIWVTGHPIESPWAYIAQDAMFLAIALATAATARRYWILWLAALIIDSMVIDVLVAFTPAISPWAYRWASHILTYAGLSLLLGDTWANARETRAVRAGRGAKTLGA